MLLKASRAQQGAGIAGYVYLKLWKYVKNGGVSNIDANAVL